MGISGQRAWDLLAKISYERLGGTPEEVKAVDTLVAELASFGVEGKKETFPIDCYKVSKATFTVLEPYVQEYTVTGVGMSGNTAEGGLEADLLYVGKAEAADLLGAEGKIVLLGDRPSVEVYGRLMKAKVAGVVVINGNVFDNPADTDLGLLALRAGHMKNGVVPGVTIRAADALDIVKRQATRGCIVLQQEQGKTESLNLVADIPGSLYPDEVIVYTAHIDSVPFSTGANDNGAGSVILMEIARHFAKHQPLRSVRFVWCGDEETGLHGSFAYVAKHEGELGNVILNINVDVAGAFLGSNTTIVTGPAGAVDVIDYLCKEIGVSMTVRHDVYSSDSVPFAEIGIPGVNFCRFGAPIHNRHDKIEYISADRLAELAEVTLLFSQRTINAKVFPVARELPDSIKKKVIDYLKNSRGKDMEIPAALK